MNDPNEVKFAENIILPTLEKKGLFSQNNEDEVDVFPYILSFSKEKDNPIIWRLYNAKIALHFNTEVFEEENKDEMKYVCNEVKYCTKDETEIFDMANCLIESVRWDIEDATEAEKYKLFAMAFIKHVDYQVENEWRVVSYDKDGLRAGSENDITPLPEVPIDIYEKGERYGNIHLYKKFVFDKSSLVGITINEQNKDSYNQIKKHLQVWLQNCGFKVDEDFIRQTETAAVR